MTSSLIISNLPTVLTKEESHDLLSHFHADEVHIFKKHRKKKAIYARFPTTSAARHALQELHQAKLGGSRLIVEFASDDMILKPISTEDYSSSTAEHKSTSCAEQMASFPFPSPLLRYAYPPPCADTLARICAALRSTPRFYTQVLHLMNKLSLPAPFAGSAVPAPAMEVPLAPVSSVVLPPPLPPPPLSQIPPPLPSVSLVEKHDVEVQTEPAESDSDSTESELASDGEPGASRPVAKRRRLARLPDSARRLRAARLQRLAAAAATSATSAAAAAPAVPLSEVFEARVTMPAARKPVLRLPAETPAPQSATNGSAQPAAVGGFAKLYPSREVAAGEVSDRENTEEQSEFITDRQLAENRLSPEDQKILPVFARYSRGDVSARLYIKNLDKRVVPADLRHVFGRYVDWNDDEHKNAFDIRLMQEGRMKGQAFISLPSTAAAERALSDTHGFILRDKPMVVQFARSARPRDTAS